MSFAVMAVLLPLLAAPVLALLGQPLAGARANLVLCVLVFLLTLIVGAAPGLGLLRADPLGQVFGVLTSFVGLTTAVGNIGFVRRQSANISPRRWRLYHALCQVVLAMTLLGLYADNTGLLWAALEAATLATAAGVGLRGTPAALAAAWRILLLGGVGLALALFGTLLSYLAAQPALGPGLEALSFAGLGQSAARLDGGLMAPAFVFLLLGYGTVAALVPLHGWLADTAAEGPAPLCATLGGLPSNVALLAILRFRHLARACAAGPGGLPPGPFLLALGLAALLFGAVALWRRGARRLLAMSSVTHSGLAVFAFGIGGAAALFGGLLNMLLHTLVRARAVTGADANAGRARRRGGRQAAGLGARRRHVRAVRPAALRAVRQPVPDPVADRATPAAAGFAAGARAAAGRAGFAARCRAARPRPDARRRGAAARRLGRRPGGGASAASRTVQVMFMRGVMAASPFGVT